jgi:hypothetical protein
MIRRAISDALNWLNGVGSIVLAYALLNPNAASELINLLPAKFHTPVALMLPAAWFMLVQYAKAKAITKEKSDAAA